MDINQKIDKIADDVTVIKVYMARMDEKQQNREEAHGQLCKRVDKHDDEIAALKSRPGKWWDMLIGAGIVAVVGVFIAWVIGA